MAHAAERDATASGLDDVVAAETQLSDVDGARGQLVIRGHAVEELVASATFEDVVFLMWNAAMPSAGEREQSRALLAAARQAAFGTLPLLGAALETPDAMDALRAAVAHLTASGDLATDRVQLTASIPVFAAAWHRARSGQSPVQPQAGLTHAADYLQMLSGETPRSEQVRGLDAYLTCVADHGMNASTFVARVVASTGSDVVSAVVAAIGALKGPLHGGAPGPVLDMLDAIGTTDRAASWIEAEIAAGRRIMGMGHRIYRVRDPRAAALERAASALEHSAAATDRLRLARAVEQAAERVLAARHPDRPLPANVEFYTAILLEAVGVPRTLFSPTFAASRVAGWLVHIEEQRRVGRLVRPSSRYVGPVPAA
jgi:citrate synthase